VISVIVEEITLQSILAALTVIASLFKLNPEPCIFIIYPSGEP